MLQLQRLAIIGVIVVAIAAAIISFVIHPTTFLHHVLPVYVIWIASWIFGVFSMIVMLAPCRMSSKEILSRSLTARQAVQRGMVSHPRQFWFGFWGSFWWLLVNTLIPLFLLVAFPIWTVIGIEALNIASNLFAIPFRKWIWGIHKEQRAMAIS